MGAFDSNSTVLKTKYFLLLCLIFLGGLTAGYAQTKQAKDYLKAGDYIDALTLLLKSYKMNPDDLDMAHDIALCYLNTNIDPKAALTYIEKVYETGDLKSDPDVIYEYGLALTYHLEFAEAKKAFLQYQQKTSSGKYSKQVERNILNCDAAEKLVKAPLNVTFLNLGDKINSEFPDYYPFVSKNDSILYFTSRRRGGLGGSKEFDGYYPSDIYDAILNTPYTKAKNVGKMVNTVGDDQVVGLSNNGNIIFVYFDMIDHYGDIYLAENKGGNFSRNFKLDNTINSKDLETSASISDDGNTLFFTSKRPGGYGGLDLYMSRKLPDGNWGTPQNLGPSINTPFDEDFPQLSSDGNTLYFTSNGLAGMGGFDIFHSYWSPESNEWSDPVNMGYPINTPGNNMTISFSINETYAYVSDVREGGFGDLDIYRVEFHNRKASKAVFIYTSEVKNLDPTLELVVYDKKNEIIGIYQPDSKGRYIVILESGDYELQIENENSTVFTENLSVTGENILNVTNYKSFTVN
jgi:tetratricopeptide (TPR) repeat protein